MRKILLIFLAAAVLTMAFPLMASAGSQDFTLVNKTGFDIYEVYVSPTQADDWQDEVLGQDALADGDSVDITFDGYSETFWDIMVKDEDGNAYYWRKINLKKISTITLYFDGENAWAETE